MKLVSNNMETNKEPITKSQNRQNKISEQNGESGQNGVRDQHDINGEKRITGKPGISGQDGVNRKIEGIAATVKMDLMNIMDRHDQNVSWADSEEDIDVEAEPVSASLILKIISEPQSTSKMKSKTPPAEEDCGYGSLEPTETYLQVLVQRSTSTSSLCKPNCRDELPQRPKSSSSMNSPRSRHCSNGSPYGAGNGSVGSYNGFWNESRYGSRSRQTSGNTTRSGSLSPTQSESNRLNSMSVVDLMNAVSHQTKLMKNGLRELRSKVDNSCTDKLPGLKDEVIIMSDLNKQASISLTNIKNLYDETKYLKSYLEKLEAKVHYNITIKQKCTTRPAWWRRLAFPGLVGITIAFIMYRRDPDKLTADAGMLANKSKDVILTFFTGSGQPLVTTVRLMGSGDV